MFSCFIRILLVFVICIAIVHAYPPLMGGEKLLPGHGVKFDDGESSDYSPLADDNGNDLLETIGFPAWLSRTRKFCCAPPL